MDLNSIQDDDPTIISIANAKVVPVTEIATVSKAMFIGSPPPNSPQQFLTPSNNHVRRLRPSNASASNCHWVSAARKQNSLLLKSAIKVQRATPERNVVQMCQTRPTADEGGRGAEPKAKTCYLRALRYPVTLPIIHFWSCRDSPLLNHQTRRRSPLCPSLSWCSRWMVARAPVRVQRSAFSAIKNKRCQFSSLPWTHDTRQIQSVQPSLSVPLSCEI